MTIYTESIEVEKTKKLIEELSREMGNVTNQHIKRKIQRRKIFLEKDVLPILQRETMLYYVEIHRSISQWINTAADLGCERLFLNLPLCDRHGETLTIGVVNPQAQEHTDNPIEWYDIYPRGNGKREINVIPIPL